MDSPTDMYGFNGKRALVAGASSGIGAAIAKKLDAYGARVALLARDSGKLANVGVNGKSCAVVADLNCPDTVPGAVESAIEQLGGLDILVISAGNGKSEYLGTDPTKADSYAFLHRISVESTLALIQAAEPALVESKGNIVAVTSLASDIPWPQTAPYNCAKAAQHALLRNTALRLAAPGVRVNAVLPACIHTEALDVMAEKKGVPADVYAAKRARCHPLGRCGTPDEVADAALFLASSKLASYITGTFLPVDGGLALTSWFNTTEMLTVGPDDIPLAG